MAAALGSLVVSLSANTAEFTRGMDKAAYQTDKAMREMKRQAEMVGAAIGAMSVVAATGLAYMIKRTIDANDSLRDMSQQTGMAVETLNGLGFAAGQAGGNLETMVKSAIKLNKAISDAAGGLKEPADAFKALGVSVIDASGDLKKADVIMSEIADKFAQYQDGPEKTAIALRLFGKAGADMIPLLNEGGDAMRANIEYAEKYSGVTAELAAASDNFNDTMGKLTLQQTGFANEMTNAVLPILQAVANETLNAAEQSDKFSLAAVALRTVLQTVVVMGSEVAYTFGRVGNMLGGMYAQIGALGVSFTDLASGPAAVTVALGKAAISGELSMKRFSAINDMIKADDVQAAKDHQAFLDSIMNPVIPVNPVVPGGTGGTTTKPNAPRLAGTTGGKGKDLDADFKAYLKNLQGQIDKTQELTTVEKLLADVRNGTLTVSPKQAAQLTALAETIDKEKELVETLKLKRDVSIAAADAVTKSNTEYQALLSRLLDATPSANLTKQRSDVRLLTDEFEAGRLSEQLYLEAVSTRLDLTGEKITQTKSAAEELGLTFSSAFEDAIVGGKAFSEVLDGLIKDIARMAIRKAVTEPMTNYVSAAIKTFLPSFAVGTEYVPSDMIAQIHKGERIIPAAQNNASSQQPVTVVQNFTVGDVASISMVRQAVAGSEKRIAGAMGRSMQYGGALS